MAAGLVYHDITTAAGVTFKIGSWVPVTTSPDLNAIPAAMPTDGTNFASFTATGQMQVTMGSTLGAAPTGAAREGIPALVVRSDAGGAVPHSTGTYSYLTTDVNGKLWVAPLAAGTAHIGEVKIDPTQLSALGQTTSAASVSVVPANDYGVPLATDKMFNGTTALTPVLVSIDVASSGANTIVAAITSKKIRLISLYLNASAAVNARWKSATNNKTGLSYFSAAGDGMVLDFNPLGWLETNAGEALVLDLSAAVAVGGCLTYVAV